MNISPNFNKVVTEEFFKPFQYGTNDCALFVANIYKRIFGLDLAEGIRGTYDDEYHASRVLVKLGHWDGILLPNGFVKKHRNMVHRGDIVICEGAAGIWTGDKAVFAGGVCRFLEKIETVYHKE